MQLKQFLQQYLDDPEKTSKPKKDIVLQEDIDSLLRGAKIDHIEQEIIDYGKAHPEAPFWDFLKLLKPGIGEGITEEELMEDDEED